MDVLGGRIVVGGGVVLVVEFKQRLESGKSVAETEKIRRGWYLGFLPLWREQFTPEQ